METVHIKTVASTGVNLKNVQRQVRCQRINGFCSEKDMYICFHFQSTAKINTADDYKNNHSQEL